MGRGRAVVGRRGRGRRCGPRARYAVRDWAAYDRSLVRRGGITAWVSPEAVKGWRAAAGRRTFSDAAIAAALAVRAVYRLALRQAEGLIASIFALLGLALPVPDHTTLSRRGRVPHLAWPRADAGCGLDLAIDSTGMRLARPSGAGREGWRKLHIAVDPESGRILAGELTRSDVHDTVPVPAMPGRIAGRLGRVHGAAPTRAGRRTGSSSGVVRGCRTPRASSGRRRPTSERQTGWTR
jgi:DDE family transposase